MFLRASDKYLYDSMLNKFANMTKIFDRGPLSTDAYIFYEEMRNYFGMDFEDSIYDRILHKDYSDMGELNIFYDTEPAISTDSVFDFYRDERVKYMAYYPEETGPFGNKITPYINRDFITAVDCKNPALLSDPYEIFMYHYLMDDTAKLVPYLNSIDKRRIKYTFNNYIFLPLVLYALRQLVNYIVCDTTIMDEKYMHENV